MLRRGAILILVLAMSACAAFAHPAAPPQEPSAVPQEVAPDRDREAPPARGEERFVEVMMLVTAYTAGPESTGKSPGHPLYGVTASGARVFPGAVAADPAIPFGTRVWVPGYGHGVVLDRGGAVRGLRLDVYIPELQEARRWGVRRLPVRIYGLELEVLEPLLGEEGNRGQN